MRKYGIINRFHVIVVGVVLHEAFSGCPRNNRVGRCFFFENQPFPKRQESRALQKQRTLETLSQVIFTKTNGQNTKRSPSSSDLIIHDENSRKSRVRITRLKMTNIPFQTKAKKHLLSTKRPPLSYENRINAVVMFGQG